MAPNLEMAKKKKKQKKNPTRGAMWFKLILFIKKNDNGKKIRTLFS